MVQGYLCRLLLIGLLGAKMGVIPDVILTITGSAFAFGTIAECHLGVIFIGNSAENTSVNRIVLS